ncbi:Beta-barrel assembly-enhancing protease [compost metagenome]
MAAYQHRLVLDLYPVVTRDPLEELISQRMKGLDQASARAAQLLGLGDLGNVAAGLGSQLLTLRFSREDESEADLVGLELAARGAYQPRASVSLWQKMAAKTGGPGIGFLSTHPTGPNRIRDLEANVPKVQGLYEQARKG